MKGENEDFVIVDIGLSVMYFLWADHLERHRCHQRVRVKSSDMFFLPRNPKMNLVFSHAVAQISKEIKISK